jgi:hypothetical protein
MSRSMWRGSAARGWCGLLIDCIVHLRLAFGALCLHICSDVVRLQCPVVSHDACLYPRHRSTNLQASGWVARHAVVFTLRDA